MSLDEKVYNNTITTFVIKRLEVVIQFYDSYIVNKILKNETLELFYFWSSSNNRGTVIFISSA